MMGIEAEEHALKCELMRVEAQIAEVHEELAKANARIDRATAELEIVGELKRKAETELARELAQGFNQLWQRALEQQAPW